MLSSRHQSQREMGTFEVKPIVNSVAAFISLAIALTVAYLPAYSGLSPDGRTTLFILLLAAGLWVSEALPAFAVGFLVIGLEIFLLSSASGGNGLPWQEFTAPWASPVIWLFMGGLIMARAAEKTGLNKRVSSIILSRFGSSQPALLFGIMAITFVFSCFMSNTATAAMMLGLMGPLLVIFAKNDSRRKAFVLAVPLAANIGGMGSLIGTPPNAVAAALLEKNGSAVGFVEWMWWGMPPAIVSMVILWIYLRLKYKCSGELPGKISFEIAPLTGEVKYVMGVFTVTVALWCSSSFHGLPSSVVAFVPIVFLCLNGTLLAEDIRQLPWEVLILLAGGLSLGVAVDKSGLAVWLVDSLPSTAGNAFLTIAIVSVFACVLSNFMSNTAAANILMPVAVALVPGQEQTMLVCLALASSTAMCLPISTPPNALACTQGELKAGDFLISGIIAGVIGTLLSLLWNVIIL